MADKGWISKYAFQNNALTADDIGRLAMQDGYLINDKIADSQITPAKMASAALTFYTGVYAYAEYGRAVYA